MVGRGRTARVLAVVGICACLLTAQPTFATRLKDLCEVQGANATKLIGVGLVVGLAGTGDKNQAAIRAEDRMLDRLDIEIPNMAEIKSDNVAVVVVTAAVPPFAKQGTRMDVLVSSVYNCESLEGGVLLDTLLKSSYDNNVYAVAQGPLSVGGFNAQGGGGGGRTRKNHVTAGRIPLGAFVEREIPSTITDGERIMFLLKTPDFITANNIQKAINESIGPGAASAFGAGSVNVLIPQEQRSDLVSFIAQVQEIEVDADAPARIVLNERTGTIVVGDSVMIRPCQIAHGDLSIQIKKTPQVSQPAPFSPQGETVETETTEIIVTEPEAFLMPVEGTSAAAVADALNKLKVTPRDMISIFQALREAGALAADLEVM